MCVVFYSRNASKRIQFHFYRDETDDDSVCEHDDIGYEINQPIRMNLQFFADDGQGGEKTEPATPKKLEDARKEGKVAKSKEIANGLGLLALFLVLKLWVGRMGISFLQDFDDVYNRIPEVCKLIYSPVPDASMAILFRSSMVSIVLVLLPVLLIGMMVAFLSDYVQVQWKPTAKPLQPKFNKLNPVSGFKKIISAQSLVELIKSIAKIGLIAFIAYSYLKGRIGFIFLLYDMPLMQAVSTISDTVIDLGIRIAAVYMILAMADFAYQKYKFGKDMRMTKQEVKEEYKNQEGNPEIKGKIRQKMREVSQRRMMQSVPQADVVITNPTHYAVALQYDPDVAPAPVVVAKGADILAMRIKDIAKENGVEIFEDKPLARMLYANVDVGAQVPPELYQAVAEVLAFVYHAQGKV